MFVLFLISEVSNGSYWHVRNLYQLQGNFCFGNELKYFAIISGSMPLSLRDYFATKLLKIYGSSRYGALLAKRGVHDALVPKCGMRC